jgi:hypothetical protein
MRAALNGQTGHRGGGEEREVGDERVFVWSRQRSGIGSRGKKSGPNYGAPFNESMADAVLAEVGKIKTKK